MIESGWNDLGMELNGMDHISGERALTSWSINSSVNPCFVSVAQPCRVPKI